MQQSVHDDDVELAVFPNITLSIGLHPLYCRVRQLTFCVIKGKFGAIHCNHGGTCLGESISILPFPAAKVENTESTHHRRLRQKGTHK